MPIAVNFNGVGYTLPVQGDSYAWGTGTTAFLAGVAQGALSRSGGSFPLSAETDFGTNFGLRVPYIRAQGTPANTGVIRLSNNVAGVVWRDAANTGDLSLTVNGSNQLTFNGSVIGFGFGSVTSVSVLPGSTRLSSSGSPITTSGSITLDVVEANLALSAIGGALNLGTQTSGLLPVNRGGTGAGTLTGYIKGAGTSALTASSTIPTSDLSGTVSLSTQVSGNLPVTNLAGGSGASALTHWRGDGVWAPVTYISNAQVAGTSLTIDSGVLIRADWGNIVTSPYFQGNVGDDTRLRVRANSSISSTATGGFQAYGSSDLANTTYAGFRTRGNNLSVTGPDIVWGTVTAGAEVDTTLPFRFIARTGGTFQVLATVNVGTASVASTDLVRRSDIPLTTKGDLLSHNGTTFAREPVGADGDILIGASSTSNGIAWAKRSSEIVGTATPGDQTIPGLITLFLITGSGTLGPHTYTLPEFPFQDTVLSVAISEAGYAPGDITFLANTGQTLAASPTSLNPGDGVKFLYRGTTWYWI